MSSNETSTPTLSYWQRFLRAVNGFRGTNFSKLRTSQPQIQNMQHTPENYRSRSNRIFLQCPQPMNVRTIKRLNHSGDYPPIGCNDFNTISIIQTRCLSHCPVKRKDFLKEAKLPDPRPLIYVCDLHGHVNELTEYLYKSSLGSCEVAWGNSERGRVQGWESVY